MYQTCARVSGLLVIVTQKFAFERSRNRVAVRANDVLTDIESDQYLSPFDSER